MKYHKMQIINNYIERNYLQTDFELVEYHTENSYSTMKYSFYFRGTLIESFLIEKGQESLCEAEAYQYMLGYLDSYIKFTSKVMSRVYDLIHDSVHNKCN